MLYLEEKLADQRLYSMFRKYEELEYNGGDCPLAIIY